MPSFFPRTSRAPVAVLSHSPRWAAAFRSGMPRMSKMISASTSSATLRVLENGALKTGMPRLPGEFQIHLVGADAEAADADQFRRAIQHLRGELRCRADAHEVRSLQGCDQRIGGQRFRMRHNVGVTVAIQGFTGARMDAFQQHDFDFAFGKRSGVHELTIFP